MRIAKSTLYRRWRWTSAAAAAVFAALALLDMTLKRLSGYGIADLQGLGFAPVRAVFYAWSPAPYAARAGFGLGLEFLFMPLYAAAFFYSGVIAREGFAPRPGRLRRLLAFAAMIPLAGAACDAVENALQFWMFTAGASPLLARFAASAGQAKLIGFTIGLVLFAAAVASRFLRTEKEPES